MRHRVEGRGLLRVRVRVRVGVGVRVRVRVRGAWPPVGPRRGRRVAAARSARAWRGVPKVGRVKGASKAGRVRSVSEGGRVKDGAIGDLGAGSPQHPGGKGF